MWDSGDIEEMSDEFRAWTVCEQHEHIVKLDGLYYDQKVGQLQVAMELLAGATLFDAINKRTKLTQAASQSELQNVASALQHLHQIGYIHRDVKPESELQINTAVYHCLQLSMCAAADILLREDDTLTSAVLTDFDCAILNSASARGQASVLLRNADPQMVCR